MAKIGFENINFLIEKYKNCEHIRISTPYRLYKNSNPEVLFGTVVVG